MTTKKNPGLARCNVTNDCHDYAAKMEISTESAKRKDPFSPTKNPPTTKRKDLGTEEGKEGMGDCPGSNKKVN